MSISVKEEQEEVGSLSSLTKQRRKVLPNPGSLEEIKWDAAKQNLELIPGFKNRLKNLVNLDISAIYKNILVPVIDLKKQGKLLPEVQLS